MHRKLGTFQGEGRGAIFGFSCPPRKPLTFTARDKRRSRFYFYFLMLTLNAGLPPGLARLRKKSERKANSAKRDWQGLKRLRKDSQFRVKCPEKHPSGAKAPLILLRFFGTAEAVPFQNNSKFEFFSLPVKPDSFC